MRGRKGERSRLLRWPVVLVAMALALGAADAAVAKKIKKTATLAYRLSVSYVDGTLRLDERFSSSNRHCVGAPQGGSMRFYIYPDPGYGIDTEYARTDYMPWKKVGRGHLLFERPGTATFETQVGPVGFTQYAGTYSYARWWAERQVPYTPSTWDGWAFDKWGNIIRNRIKVKYRRHGVLYVVKCELDYIPDPNEDQPPA